MPKEMKREKAAAEKHLPARHLENRLRDPSHLSEAMLLASAFEIDDMLTRAHANRMTWGNKWAWLVGFPLDQVVFGELQRRSIVIPEQLRESFDCWCDAKRDPHEAIRNIARKNGWQG